MNKSIAVIFLSATVLFISLQTQAMPDGKKKKNKGDKGQSAPAVSQKEQQKRDNVFMEAERAKVIEDWDLAIKNYLQLVELDPANSNAHFQLAQIYFNQGKMQDAEREAQLAVKLDGSNKWYQELLANLYLNEGKTKEAVETFRNLLDKFPGNPDYYLNLAYLYAKIGQLENSLKVYDQFEKNFGIDEQVVAEKKNIYLHLGKFNEAVNEVKKLEDEFPGETEYLLQEAELYRANKMKDKAIEIYKKVLALEPDNPQAQLAMAGLNMKQGDEGQNQQNLKEIFENPKVGIDTKVSILLISYIQMNNEDSAKRKEGIELAKILGRVHPDEAKSFAVLGDLYFLDEQNDKAIEAYKKSLAISKDVFEVWQQLMLIYNEKRDWNNVLDIANQAMELFPNQAPVYLFKGGAEQQLAQYDKAAKSYSKGEKMSADNTKLRAQFLANLGDVYHSLNKSAESDTAYEKSLKLDPDNAFVLNNYSYYLSLRKENLERAKQMSAYSNQLDPGNSSFLDTYGWILFQLNDFKAAKEWQEKAMKAGGDKSGTILEHYGDILFKLGEKGQAVEYWKKAKELGTESPSLDKKISEGKYIE
ncbi:MAG: tetratricopeptide repeat protein [Chitinophagales bacterium]